MSGTDMIREEGGMKGVADPLPCGRSPLQQLASSACGDCVCSPFALRIASITLGM